MIQTASVYSLRETLRAHQIGLALLALPAEHRQQIIYAFTLYTLAIDKGRGLGRALVRRHTLSDAYRLAVGIVTMAILAAV